VSPILNVLKTLALSASVIKALKLSHAITTACQIFAHTNSTLLVKCFSTNHKVSVFAVFSDDISEAPNRFRPHERQGRSGQPSLVSATNQIVLFHTLATCFHEGHSLDMTVPSRACPSTVFLPHFQSNDRSQSANHMLLYFTSWGSKLFEPLVNYTTITLLFIYLFTDQQENK
jgi:hypothetical protein